MAIVLGNNIPSLKALRELNKGMDAISKVQERLSGGMRITRASDDAAGLAVSMSLDVDTRLFTQAIRNINDGISISSIAESALGELLTITSRHVELAEQSANGTLSVQQRRALQREADQLTDEFNRIVSTTQFNGVQLFNASSGTTQTTIQLGNDSGGALTLDLRGGSSMINSVSDGTYASSTTVDGAGGLLAWFATGDINNDGRDDIAYVDGTTSTLIRMANADGTFTAATTIVSTVRGLEFADLNNDGNLDLVRASNAGASGAAIIHLGNGDGTFAAAVTYSSTGSNTGSDIDVGDINGDGILDLALTSGGSKVSFFLGNGDGTFRTGAAFSISGGTEKGLLADITGDGVLDYVVGSSTSASLYTYIGSGDGNFRSAATVTLTGGGMGRLVESGDFNRDGLADIAVGRWGGGITTTIMLSNGDGTFSQGADVAGWCPGAPADANGDGYLDIITGSQSSADGNLRISFGNGDGTFKSAITSAVPGMSTIVQAEFGDFNGDGALDISGSDFVAGGKIGVQFANRITTTSIPKIDILSAQAARSSLTDISTRRSALTSALGVIGASQSRLHVSQAVQRVSRDAYAEASSRIKDADIAVDAAELIRQQIKVQAAAAVSSQANNLPALVLKLLQ